MEHGIPLSRRAAMLHSARISREEWLPLAAVVTCTLLHLESAIRWPGTREEGRPGDPGARDTRVQRSRSSADGHNVSRRYEYVRRLRESCGSPVPSHQILRDGPARSAEIESAVAPRGFAREPPDPLRPSFKRSHLSPRS